MSEASKLERPYVWFGGKAAVAPIVWRRFGAVPNYVEPFFGGGAVFLLRPESLFYDGCGRETINDFDGYVANFWRSVQANPDATALAACRLVSELDLHAIGDALFCRPSKRWPQEPREFVEWLRADESHFCPERAGAWAWFVNNWIGGLPAVGESAHQNPAGIHRRLPHLGGAGRGVSRQLPHLGDAGTLQQKQQALTSWFLKLQSRLAYARVCCGDWSRVCGKSVTWNNATPCGVFLDPPYSAEAGRDNNLYSEECGKVAHECRAWCVAEGANRDMRIALCGYTGEGHEELEQHGWDCFRWKASGGYANVGNNAGKANARREAIWFSPGCLPPDRTDYPLFSEDDDAK